MRTPTYPWSVRAARAFLLCVFALGAVACVSSTGTPVAWSGAGHAVVVSSPVPTHIRLGGHYGERIGRSGEETFHAGLDFAAPSGTETYAVADGVVTFVAHEDDAHSRLSGYGNAIVVHHPALEVWTMYAHLSAVTVAEGDVVVAGSPMGLTGSTTNGRFRGMGAHLHFEVRRVRADGSDPFPGTYGRHNLDPEDWLAELGVVYGRRGVLETGEVVAETEAPELGVEDRAWLVTHYHEGEGEGEDDAVVAAAP